MEPFENVRIQVAWLGGGCQGKCWMFWDREASWGSAKPPPSGAEEGLRGCPSTGFGKLRLPEKEAVGSECGVWGERGQCRETEDKRD